MNRRAAVPRARFPAHTPGAWGFCLFALGVAVAAGCLTGHAPAQVAPMIAPFDTLPGSDAVDPVPIQRLVTPLDRIQAELEKTQQGRLVRLSRQDFETRLGKARLADQSLRNGPRLLEASYQARLEESALVGKASWRLVNPNSSPGILTLRPFNLAIQQPVLDSGRALLGDIEEGQLGLLVEKAGPHTLAFDWSVRGEAGPGGVRFELRLPSCALTTLELELPADRSVLAAREQCLVAGPFTGKSAGKSRWLLDLGGHSQVEIQIRPTSRVDRGGPLLLTRLESRHSLMRDEVESTFDFNLEASRGNIQELTLACDPGLAPLAVAWRNNDLEDWEVLPSSNATGEKILRIRLPEPLQGGPLLLRVRCVSASPVERAWIAPQLTLRQAIMMAENMTVHVAADLALDDWRPGQFDLLKASTDAAGGYALQLQAGPISAQAKADPASRRPRAQIRLQKSEVHARQQLWWDITPLEEHCHARIQIQLRSGRLFRLQGEVPAGWRVDKVRFESPVQLADWGLTPVERGEPLIVVHLAQALEGPGEAVLLVDLTRPRSALREKESYLPVPRLDLAGVPTLLAEVRANVAPQLVVTASVPQGGWLRPDEDSKTSSLPLAGTAPASPEMPPWAGHAVWRLTRYHGMQVAGGLYLQSRNPGVKARASADVKLGSHESQEVLRLTIEPVSGAPTTVDVRFSGDMPDSLSWRSLGQEGTAVTFRRVEPWEFLTLPILAGGPASWTSPAVLAGAPSNLWRFEFSEPLAQKVLLESAPLRVPGNRPWKIPLPVSAAGRPIEGEVTLTEMDPAQWQIDSRGMTPRDRRPVERDQPAGQAWSYLQDPVALSVRPAEETTSPSGTLPSLRDVVLTSFVDDTGRIFEHLALRLPVAGAGPPCTLDFPAHVKVLAVRIGGRWSLPQLRTHESGSRLTIANSRDPQQAAVEILYEQDGTHWKIGHTQPEILPAFPTPVLSCRHIWCLAPGLVPGRTSGLAPLPGPANWSWQVNLDRVVSAWRNLGQDRARLQVIVNEAELQLRNLSGSGKQATLGERLELLITELNKARLGLVIDGLALSEAGLTLGSKPPEGPGSKPEKDGIFPRFAIQAPALAAYGLVLDSCRSVPLLTTRVGLAQLRLTPGTSTSSATDAAVFQALCVGRDTSGRFVNVLNWLTGSDITVENELDSDAILQPFATWPRWDETATSSEAGRLLVVRESTFVGGGLILAIVVSMAGWRLRACRQHLARMCSGILILLALAWMILPATLFWDLFFLPALCLLLLLGGLSLPRVFAPTVAEIATEAATVAVALGVLVGIPALAAEPALFRVLFLPGQGGRDGGVLAPPDLLEALDRLTRRSAQPLDHPLLLEASYDGLLADGVVDLNAEFLVHCPREGTTDYLLSLGTPELREARVDDKPAYPAVSSTSGRSGFLFKLAGSGPHRLRLAFSATTRSAGADRELRLMIPETPSARLNLRAGKDIRRLQAVVARGSQRLAKLADGTRLDADLGAVPVLQVRWATTDAADKPAIVQVREQYYWELQSCTDRILGVLNYQIVQGSVRNLDVDLPREWDLRRVETGSLTAASAAPRLRDWTLEQVSGRSRLHLEFQNPVTSGVRVFLELLNPRPLETRAALTLPAPVSAVTAEGLLACRADSREIAIASTLGLTGIDLDRFVVPWQASGAEDAGPPVRAFSFRRSAGISPALVLDLREPANRLTTSQEISWHVGPRGLYCDAVMRLTIREDDLAMAEWDVPANLILGEITGPDLRAWSRTGNRVQTWFRQTINKTELEWRAWTTKQPGSEGSAAIPVIACLKTAALETSLRFMPEPGWMLRAGSWTNLHAVASTGPGLVATSDQPTYSGTLFVSPQPEPARPSGDTAKQEPNRSPSPRVFAPKAFLIYGEQGAYRSGPGWEHRGLYALAANGAEVRVLAPDGATFTGATLDGQEIRIEDVRIIRLVLAAGPGSRIFCVTWQWPQENESADQPNLATPVLEGAGSLPGAEQDHGWWSIGIPRGDQIQPEDTSALASSQATRYLRRAVGELRLIQLAALEDRNLIDEGLARFYRNLRIASSWMAALPTFVAGPGQFAGLEAEYRRLELAARNQAQELHFEEARRQAELAATRGLAGMLPAPGAGASDAFLDGQGVEGRVLSAWQGEVAGTIPRLRVARIASRSAIQWLDFPAFCVICALILIASARPAAHGWRESRWPEFATLLLLATSLLAGSWWLAAGAIAIGVSLRLWLIASHLLSHPAQAEATA